jgi:hypothetical protein
MNKIIGIMAIVATMAIASVVIGIMSTTQQNVNAVCSTDGRCTGPGGTNGTAGTISPCIDHKRTLTTSDGRNLTQAC